MSKKTKKPDFTFPETLYVGIENCNAPDPEDKFFIATESYEGLEVSNTTRPVAVYQLVDVRTLSNKGTLI